MRYGLVILCLLLFSNFKCFASYDEFAEHKYCSQFRYNRDGTQMDPPLSTMYLVRNLKQSDKDAMVLFEKCLLTYYWELVKLGQYEADDTLRERLSSKALPCFLPLENYTSEDRISSFLNSILPAANTQTSQSVRRPFSLLLNSLDLHSAVDQLRLKYPIAADYIDYLFHKARNEIKYSLIYTDVTKNCANQLSEVELLILFSMHCLGEEGKTNLTLAQEEANRFDGTGTAATAQLILKLARNRKKE